ncbi:sterol desaturase family protein [Ascidiaceihabitans sp.]|uniref:sterol desaturase family protein n=1 Tax=Ascidiaceihabitans sp. TaxID=1872644 RepID=UPI003297AFF0
MRPVEHVFFLGSVLVHYLVAADPIHILLHLQYDALTAATTHTGFEERVVKDKNRLNFDTFHHQMHRRYFECNYGSLEISWDKLFGSFHDATEAASERIKERQKTFGAG